MTSRASLGLFHVLLAILWLPIVATAQQPGRELVQIPVVNKTTSIKVVGLYKVLPNNPNSAYSMVMENASGKDIVAYSIGYREHSSIGYEGVGETIPSGKRFERLVQRTENITVRYVIFEDGSIDGDPAAAAEWIDRQHAEAEQFERILALLDRTIESQDIEWLIAQIRELPEETTENTSIHFQLGLRGAKDQILLDVKLLEKENLASELDRLKTETAVSLKRVRRLLPKS